MAIHLNIVLFMAFGLMTMYKITFTDYQIKNGRDVWQLFVTFLATVFFFVIDQYLIDTDSLIPDDWYKIFIILGLVVLYAGIGAGSIEVFLRMVKRGQKIAEDKIDNINLPEQTP